LFAEGANVRDESGSQEHITDHKFNIETELNDGSVPTFLFGAESSNKAVSEIKT